MDRQTVRWTDRHSDGQTDSDTMISSPIMENVENNCITEVNKVKLTDRQSDGQTDRQMDRQRVILCSPHPIWSGRKTSAVRE